MWQYLALIAEEGLNVLAGEGGMTKRRFELKKGAKLTLFLVSYIPLFLIMCFSQVYTYREYLNWGGLNLEALVTYLQFFGVASVLMALSFLGVLGVAFLIPNMRRRAESNGVLEKVVDIENKSNESISYLFTYIIPFVFQDLSSVVSVFSIGVLLVVTYLIYSNSSMVLINPVLSVWYSLYLVEYEDFFNKQKRRGMVLSRNQFLEEGDMIKVKSMGYKLYYSVAGGGDD